MFDPHFDHISLMRHSSDADTVTVNRPLQWPLRWCLAALAVAAASVAAPAAGEEHTRAPAGQGGDADGAAVPPFAPPLAPAEADEAGRQQAAAALRVATHDLRTAQGVERRAVQRLGSAEELVALRTAEVQTLSEQEQAIAAQLEQTRAELRGVAIERYVGGGRAVPLNFLLASADAAQLARRTTIANTAADAQQDAIDRYAAAREAASILVGEAVGRLEEAQRALDHARAEAAAAGAEVRRLGDVVARRKLLVDLVGAAASVPPSDIPGLFLDAYQRAAAAMAERRPACKVRWTALAAIGRVESGHGRTRGARLALNGDLWPVILGKQLDGTSNTRRIADTDGGEYDGDSVVDRAVGPMQFIPRTWQLEAVDASGDGTADIHNINDAALAAANYLCRDGRDLSVAADWWQAVLSYNNVTTYANSVYSAANEYGQLSG